MFSGGGFFDVQAKWGDRRGQLGFIAAAEVVLVQRPSDGRGSTQGPPQPPLFGIDRIGDKLPDEITILTSRYLLEMHSLSKAILEIVKPELSSRGVSISRDTMADATLTAAPAPAETKR